MRLPLLMVFVLTALAATAGARPLDASRTPHEAMLPIRGPERVLFEGFETSVPPPGWSAVVNNPYTWEQNSSGPYEGTSCASCDYDETYSGPQNESICVDYTIQAGDNYLWFYAMGSTYWAVDPYQNYNFRVKIDGVGVWNYHDDNDGAVTWQWQRYVVDLTGYGIGQDISVCLVYQGYDGAQASFDALAIGDSPPPEDPCCPSASVCQELNFNANGGGGVAVACGAGPVPWAWGTMAVHPPTDCDDEPISNEWGTNSGSDYPAQKGEALVVGPLDITVDCTCLGLCHYYDIEDGYDGGNVKVSTDGGSTWELVYPHGGYDDVLDSSTHIAECVAGEQVFTGDSVEYVRDCFDLSAYVGEQVKVGFFFGSDDSSEYAGWYLRWLKLGSDSSPVEESSWGSIKAMYR
ncbi:MAG: hypothetical protein ABIG03_02045 [Candidatus Eisenbacteria bacterium]